MRLPKDHMVKLFHNNKEPIIRNFAPCRNDFCTCGSGKKYKKCCMTKQIVNATTGEKFEIKSGL